MFKWSVFVQQQHFLHHRLLLALGCATVVSVRLCCTCWVIVTNSVDVAADCMPDGDIVSLSFLTATAVDAAAYSSID